MTGLFPLQYHTRQVASSTGAQVSRRHVQVGALLPECRADYKQDVILRAGSEGGLSGKPSFILWAHWPGMLPAFKLNTLSRR